ncbi:MATE family efflux transporter [Helicobacter sp. 23-1044]
MGNISGSLLAIFANVTLLQLSGALGVAVYAAIVYIDELAMSAIMAINTSLQPILSYFFAQRNRAEIMRILRFLICVNAIFSLVVFVILIVFRAEFAGLFAPNATKGEGIEFVTFMSVALLLYNLNYLVMWFNALVSELLSAFDKPTFSMILSLMANLIAPLAFLLILPRIFGVNGVFLVGFFAEICVVILSVILLKKCLRF